VTHGFPFQKNYLANYKNLSEAVLDVKLSRHHQSGKAAGLFSGSRVRQGFCYEAGSRRPCKLFPKMGNKMSRK
jgi:hypothetical protein